MLMHLSHRFINASIPAVSSTVGLRVDRRHHLQSVCLQDVVLVVQTDEKSGLSVLQHPPYSPDLAPSDFHLTTKMTMG
ncbi:hypothetical protein AVEN_170213-1 [Araneus ventricosus]|uniref:Tc1-like transposase DDE domain-containing protein n=1 Tax=Araneus ventricosus TaxID=182803 RepID=A0A4Y2L0J7_ARAVE|nr:hypothetical protein AVEN_170213-1 [Araneus ventricosus]